MFRPLIQKLEGVPIIAEDLGVITPDVHELREAIGAPGMVVLQFAWGSGATNTHLPHNHYENSVCYPGKAPGVGFQISNLSPIRCHGNATVTSTWEAIIPLKNT